MVLDADQIRHVCRRKGYCDTCGIEPNKCFKIKKSMGGLIREKVALTKPGKVFKGICLDCHPKAHEGALGTQCHIAASPDAATATPHDRGDVRLLPYSMVGEEFDGLVGRSGVRNIRSKSMQPSTHTSHAETREYSTYLPIALEHQDRADWLELLEDYNEQQQEPAAEQALPKEGKYVKKIEYDIFNEPVLVRKKEKKKSHPGRSLNQQAFSSPARSNGDRVGSPHNSPRQQSHGHHAHTFQAEEEFEEQVHDHQNHSTSLQEESQPHPSRRNVYDSNGNSPPQYSLPLRHNAGRRSSPNRGGQIEEPTNPSFLSLLKSGNNNNDAANQSKSSAEEESLDALAQLLANYCATHLKEDVEFVPGATILPNSQLCLPDIDDDLSVLTFETFFKGRGSRSSQDRQTNPTFISRSSSAVSGQQRCMVSHQIREPDIPAHVARQAGISVEPAAATTATNNNAQDMESYLKSSAPHLLTLREIVGQCTQAGADAEAIDVVTQALIHDSATSMSTDLALFCVTTLWVLASKSEENKRKIIFEDATFDAIIEAMKIYRELSADVLNRACCVLWSLSVDPNHRKHVAQGGGCEAIVDTMLVYTENDALLVVAFGALKALSFDNVGKSMLRSRGTLSIVAGIMQNHAHNPAIQSKGCIILGNLTVDDTNHFVAPVSKLEVEAVIRGIINHPDSLEIHQAACFTLMGLVSSAVNAELIRHNNMTRVALELACEKHSGDVDVEFYVFMLLRRLYRVNSSVL